MWIVSFVFHPGIQRLCEQDPGQILWNWIHKTESNRRQQAQGRHSGGGRENRAVQAGVSVYLRLGDPWQASVGGDLHQRQHTQCKCIDCKLCAWFNLPHEVTFFLTHWRKRRWASNHSVLLNTPRFIVWGARCFIRAHPDTQSDELVAHLCHPVPACGFSLTLIICDLSFRCHR